MTNSLNENEKPKYNTLGQAIKANDVEACRTIYHKYTVELEKELSEDEIFSLGILWFKTKNRNLDVVDFLKEIHFDFEINTVADNESAGKKIPFRMIQDKEDQNTLEYLLKKEYISKNIMDGNGDSLLVEALQESEFDFAERLLTYVDINATNLMGNTALHYFASRLNFTAVNWLCEHGAHPEIENLMGEVASQLVPESMENWDPESMYNTLEDYMLDFNKGQKFNPNEIFIEQLNKELSEKDSDSDLDSNMLKKDILKQFGL